MLAVLLADATGDVVQIVGPIIGAAVGICLTIWIHNRRDTKSGEGEVVSRVQELEDTVAGPKKTRMNPHPPPGLDQRVEDLEGFRDETLEWRRTVEATQKLHTEKLDEVLKNISPNGGNTRGVGDLLLLIAEKVGVDVPPEVVPHGDD